MELFRIAYPYQAQPMRRSGRTGVCLTRLPHNQSKLIHSQTFLPNQQQSANHSANLPREKSIRSKITIDKSVLADTFRLEHCSHAGVRPWSQGIALIGTAPESPKSLAPRQFSASGLHQINIQRLRAKVAIPGQQSSRSAIVPDRIAIGTTPGTIAGVEAFGNLLRPAYSY